MPILIISGVSGSGKTTVGSLLAQELGWIFLDADDFHPPESMRIRWQRTHSSTCHCATCGKRFAGGKRVRHLFSDGGWDLGPICPECCALSPQHLREQIRRYAYLIHLNRLRHPGSREHARHLEQVAKERSIRYPGLWGWLRQWRHK